MKTKIYYFSGTGNSLWVAKELTLALDDAEFVSIPQALEEAKQEDIINVATEKVGLVFPVYAWGLPNMVVSFIKKLDSAGIKYCFAVATYGSNGGGTLIETKNLLTGRGIELQAGFGIALPSNYIISNGALRLEKQAEMITKARRKLSEIIPRIANNERTGVPKGNFIINAFGNLAHSFFMKNPDKARDFSSDLKCTSCGTCVRVCPTANIVLNEKNKPVWDLKCEQCLACIQWCPSKAIQYKRSTQYRNRYHHPEVTLEEIAHRKADNKSEAQNVPESGVKRFRTLKIKRSAAQQNKKLG